MKLLNPTLVLFLLFALTVSGQNKKILNISKTSTSPKIDGVLDDIAWENIDKAQNFTQFNPKMGVAEEDFQKTEVKITYNNSAIFVAAYLHDKPENIMKQFTNRDNFGQADFFTLIFNPNNDAQNDLEFSVLSCGTQADAVYSTSNGRDYGWNAIWDSAVKIVDDGWIIEMKIPYAALRFSKNNLDTWGIQLIRHHRKTRYEYSWNPIDRTKNNRSLFHGELKGLENISPPVRLSFYPFFSSLINSTGNETTNEYILGLDMKYGISENFTFDATLIPDFSQAGADDIVLNLTPFEVQFSEQRQFFSEGVDLFNKGNLFYSRRVGNAPTGEVNLNINEEINNYPEQVKTLNAIKVSGRTKKGLGIGFFNAITEKTEAKIIDTLTQNTRLETVEPLSNYNILVIDQQFNGNSSASIINTNVTRNSHFRDANVTGLLLNLTNKKNTYNANGEVKMSSINHMTDTENGFSYRINLEKISGNYQFKLSHFVEDNKYDINDLGFMTRNNKNNFSFVASHQIFEPTNKLNSYNITTWIDYKQLHLPRVYTDNEIGLSVSAETKKIFSFGSQFVYKAGKQFDYFEPRTEGRYFIYENQLTSLLWISSNYNKKFAIDVNLVFLNTFEKYTNLYNYIFRIYPRIRFNDKFIVVYGFTFDDFYGDRGFVTNYNNEIVFGERDQKVIENSISANYQFNSFHGLGLEFRNYWSTVTYNPSLFTLQPNGRLSSSEGITTSDISNPNTNFNSWNLDIRYSWQFAPGSQLTFLYRNNLLSNTTASNEDYFKSIETLFNENMNHLFSLRLVYYIDYTTIKNMFKKDFGK